MTMKKGSTLAREENQMRMTWTMTKKVKVGLRMVVMIFVQEVVFAALMEKLMTLRNVPSTALLDVKSRNVPSTALLDVKSKTYLHI